MNVYTQLDTKITFLKNHALYKFSMDNAAYKFAMDNAALKVRQEKYDMKAIHFHGDKSVLNI